MKRYAEREIVADIEEFGDELRGDAAAIASVLEALVLALGGGGDPVSDDPDYGSYEDSPLGRMVAESAVASDQIWESLRNQLTGIAHELRHTADYYI